ncbi:acetoin utilization protein AcuC [Rhodobacteraceae bacterium 2376]|uniref:Acetoin utilization protein AcuC n=1 Tax=Rhabdonatronobacter sediminivivens TaxID=2743469 RepID=A0A7Z0I0I9_9RHOB|nr:acetoin utilization protein AcuC [Rhabdonatronobacter sediminivivens]NYS25412.1 acetoin utilization protein AcuC [Rhabdonatronobacter sediminivivens]
MQQPIPRFIGSEVYRGSSYGPWHPLRIPRVPTVMDLGRALGWLGPDTYINSPRAKPVALELWHTPRYIAALQRAEAEGAVDAETRTRHALGTTANPVFAQIFRRPATSAGGVMLAAELVAHGGVVHVPGGGTHHAFPDRANGFCYINDPVLCLLALRRQGLERLVYVDIDAHHCDGVEHAFAGDPAVRMISVHEERRWPFTGALEDRAGGAGFNLPVPRGFNDTEMEAVLDRLILPRTAEHCPDAIVLQCGADAVTEDPLSRLALSNNAHRRVALALRDLAPRLIVLGGGGYNPWSVARCWTGVWGALSGQEIPDRLPPQAEAVLRTLRWPGARAGKTPPESWFTTLADPPRPGPLRQDIRDRLNTLAQR